MLDDNHDLSYNLNIAKWFALNRLDPATRRYPLEAFGPHASEDDLLDEASSPD